MSVIRGTAALTARGEFVIRGLFWLPLPRPDPARRLTFNLAAVNRAGQLNTRLSSPLVPKIIYAGRGGCC